MVPPRDSGAGRPNADIDADFTGWDPYIVAITGGAATGPNAAPGDDASSSESRKVKLMAWLREHGA